MTTTIIISICALVLIAYIFDLTASKTKIPSVILLLLSGWVLRELSMYFSWPVPDLSPALPVLGTIGLILIVLEGSLELEFNRSKFLLIRQSFFTALVPMIILAFALAYGFQYFGEHAFRNNLINAIPFCVISSAIAIPSAGALSKNNRAFVIYESSLSDIIGVLLFNFIALNHTFGVPTFWHFALQLLLITILSFVATIGLAFLLKKIAHHVKFVPIILLTILIYAISKIYHLPGLIFILVFGLFLGNLDELKIFKRIEKLDPEALQKEVQKFKDLTSEGAFFIRALFFLLFGYLIDTSEILNTHTLVWAVSITAAIYALRAIQLTVSRLPLLPLLFISPRGLITILLFLSIDAENRIALVNRSLIIQVIVLTALVMMVGLMVTTKHDEQAEAAG